MGVDTRIMLPLHVRSEHAIKFAARVMGEECEMRTFPNTSWKPRTLTVEETARPFDPDAPSSADNPWHLRFTGPKKEVISESGVDFGRFEFHDINGGFYSWLFFQETENEEYKLLNPSSYPVAIAVGRRLVEFFGGKMQYSDHADTIDYEVEPANALFPPKAPGQDSDARWYQFYNALWNAPMITAQELRAAGKLASYGMEENDERLAVALEVRIATQTLEAGIAQAPEDEPEGVDAGKPRKKRRRL